MRRHSARAITCERRENRRPDEPGALESAGHMFNNTATGMTTRTRWPARVAAAGFLVGGGVHAVAFALLGAGVELYGRSYPPLRHVLMASIDAAVGYIGVIRPTWLLIVLPVYVAQRLAFNRLGWEAIVVAIAWLVLVVEWRLGSAKAPHGRLPMNRGSGQ